MRDPSPYAGQTVTLRADVADVGGLPCAVVDWYERTGTNRTWQAAATQTPIDVRARSYAFRRGVAGLPDDDDVLSSRVDGMTMLVHVTEIQGYTPTPTAPTPNEVHEDAIGLPCPACQVLLEQGDMVATLLLGPGADPTARAAALAGQVYTGMFTQLHWACRTGDTQYEEV